MLTNLLNSATNLSSNTTILLSALTTLVVYLVLEIVKYFIFDKIKKEKDLKEKALYALNMYGCYYMNPIDLADYNGAMPEKYDKASLELRNVAAIFAAYEIHIKFKSKKEKYHTISQCFYGLSNSVSLPYKMKEELDNQIKHSQKKKEKIERLLKIKTLK